MRRGTAVACAAALAAVAASAGCQARDAVPEAGGCAVARDALVPRDGAWFGVSLDGDDDTLRAYAHRLRRTPSVAASSVRVPLRDTDRVSLAHEADQARTAGAMLMLTLEPREGLVAVTDRVAEDVARLVDGVDRGGVPVFVRFAPDMNSSWQPWGQEPIRYVRAFRRVADAVHRLAPGSPMVWAPGYGGGYPFPGGAYRTKPGTLGAEALDVDGDGVVSQADDPYAPYWPGRGVVDWVGMSLFPHGAGYPAVRNEDAEPGELVAMLRGRYAGADGDESAVPDFYETYAEGQRRPLAITETAAPYARGRGGTWQLEVERSWWQQVFRAPAEGLSLVKLVAWYEHTDDTAGEDGQVDWAVTRSPTTLAPFREDLPAWLRFAGDVPRCS